MIDTHVHFWDYNLNIHTWIHKSQRDDLKRSFMLADYLQQFSQPEAIVTIEASDGIYTLQEVHWIEQYIVNNPWNIPIKHMAYIDVLAPTESFSKQLNLFDAYSFICGFRCILLNDFDAKYIKDNLILLKNKNYIFDGQMRPGQFLKICDIIDDSGVNCIIDHVVQQEWLDLLQVNAPGSVYFKITENNPEMIEKLLQYIPKNRLVIGSNYPVNSQDISAFPKDLIKHSNINARKLFNF